MQVSLLKKSFIALISLNISFSLWQDKHKVSQKHPDKTSHALGAIWTNLKRQRSDQSNRCFHFLSAVLIISSHSFQQSSLAG